MLRSSSASESMLIVILLAVITVDTMLSNLTDLLIPSVPVQLRLAVFSILGLIAMLSGTYICLREGKSAVKSGGGSRLISQATRAMRVIQFVLVGFISAVLIEELLFGQYHSLFVIGGIVLSYYTSGILLAILSYKFIQWFRARVKNRKNKVFLFFLLSSSTLSLIVTMSIPAQAVLLFHAFPNVVTSSSVPQFPTLEGTLSDFVQLTLAIPYLIAPPWVLFTWIGSTLMLKSYSDSIGRKVFWSLILGSLATIIVGSVMAYSPNTNGPFDKSLLIFRIIGISSIIIQGFLVGFAFLRVSRNVDGKVPPRIVGSLRTSAIGISLLFASVSANLAFGAFPPFGMVSYCFVALGGYLFVTGVYSSAVSVSTDTELRKMMRRIILDKSGFIDSIGTANLDVELTKLVISMSKKYVESIEESTNLEFPISDTEYHQYLNQTLQELAKLKYDSQSKSRSN